MSHDRHSEFLIKEKKLVTCPYCNTIFQCNKDTEFHQAIRAHHNKSTFCKEKRKRGEIQIVSNASKQQKCQNDIGKLETLRHRLSNATTENLPNYWESDDDVHIDVEDFYQESQVDFDDDERSQSPDIPIDEQDSDEAGLDETESFVADGGLDDVAEDIVDFEQQNLDCTSDNAFHIDNEEKGDEAQEMKEELDVPLGSRMFEHECLSNDIRTKQQLIRLFYFDNMPAKFNRVLGEQVDVDAAIQFLDHMVEMHMSESEGDDFLALMDRIVLYNS